MGIDLAISPDRFPMPNVKFLASNRLGFEGRYYDLWDKLEQAADVTGETILWCEDDGWTERTENPYGTPLKFITAGKFVEAVDASGVTTMKPFDSAIVGFVRLLPPDTRLLLWFH